VSITRAVPQVLLWLGKDAAWNLLSPTMCLSPACRLTPCFVITVRNRWLPFALTTVLVGADFIIMTSRVAGGLVDHVHQVRVCSSPVQTPCCGRFHRCA
jgi:hypothetical protein